MTSILEIVYGSIFCFMLGLRLTFCMATQSLVTASRTFTEFSDHYRIKVDMQLEGHDKRPKIQGKFCGSHYSFGFRGGIPYVRHSPYPSFLS